MPTPGNYFFIFPGSQSYTWYRGTPFPDFSSVNLTGLENSVINYIIQFDNTSVDWLSLTGDVSSSAQQVLFPPGSFEGNVLPVAQDLDLLTGSFYSAKIRFTYAGVTKIHTVNLNIMGASSLIKTDKTNYNVVFNRITNTVSGDTIVNILNNSATETLSFATFGNLFLEKSFTTYFTLEEDPAFPFSTSAELPAIGSKIISCILIDAAGTSIQTFTVTIQVVNTNDITADQNFINFSLYKHLSETKSQILKIINPANLAFTVTAPDFVNLNVNSGNTTTDIEIVTDNSADLLAQTYSGDIVISYGAKTVTVPVSVKNIDFIDLKVGDYNFCLDDFILKVQRINDTGKFVKVSLEITISTATESFTVSPNYQIAYFNNEASTDVGKKIHSHFPMYENHLFDQDFQVDFNNKLIYNAAKVKITIEELNSNYEVIYSRVIDNVRMFPGRKPKMFPLFTNSQIKSRYSNTGYIFTYLTSLVSPSDITEKAVSNNPFSPDQVQSAFFEDVEELMDFGDFKNVLGIDFLKKEKGDQQIYVQFINQNLVPEMAVFNGFYKIEEDPAHTYDDFEINAKKYSTKVIGKATLSTGFIFKEESEMVSEISKSLLSFVKVDDVIYKCLPIPGKMEKVNSESNLVIFELEFLIVK
jgi:hypothetical protein